MNVFSGLRSYWRKQPPNTLSLRVTVSPGGLHVSDWEGPIDEASRLGCLLSLQQAMQSGELANQLVVGLGEQVRRLPPADIERFLGVVEDNGPVVPADALIRRHV